MKTAVVVIVKLENAYLPEFVEHYRHIGFSCVIVYDNNDVDGENVSDVLKGYVDDGFVIIEDVRGLREIQKQCYTDAYAKYGKQYDWIAFFDCDEFLEIEGGGKIEEVLSRSLYSGYNGILVKWKVYGDNGLVDTGEDYSVKRFKEPCNKSNVLNYRTKIILRGGIDGLKFSTTSGGEHGHHIGQKCCDVLGNFVETESALTELYHPYKTMWLNHYYLKTIKEFVKFKLIRQYPNMSDYTCRFLLNISHFFGHNEYTEEKIKKALSLLPKNPLVYCDRDDLRQFFSFDCRSADYELHVDDKLEMSPTDVFSLVYNVYILTTRCDILQWYPFRKDDGTIDFKGDGGIFDKVYLHKKDNLM